MNGQCPRTTLYRREQFSTSNRKRKRKHDERNSKKQQQLKISNMIWLINWKFVRKRYLSPNRFGQFCAFRHHFLARSLLPVIIRVVVLCLVPSSRTTPCSTQNTHTQCASLLKSVVNESKAGAPVWLALWRQTCTCSASRLLSLNGRTCNLGKMKLALVPAHSLSLSLPPSSSIIDNIRSQTMSSSWKMVRTRPSH